MTRLEDLLGRIGEQSLSVAAILGLLALIWRGGRKLFTLTRRLSRLADDLLGEPAHGDQPARPSLLDRVSSVEDRLIGVERRLVIVESEVQHNSGHSLKDQVAAMRADVATLVRGMGRE